MAHNRFDRHVAKQFQGLDATSVSRESISCIGPAQYEVLSRSEEGVAYIADTAIGVCSCPVGNNGRPCVHQAAISFYFHADSLNVIPTVSVAGRIRFAELAVGKRNVKRDDFYASLHQEKLESEVNPSPALVFTSQQSAAECSVLGEASSSESANATSTDKVSSVLYDPAEVATSDGPC